MIVYQFKTHEKAMRLAAPDEEIRMIHPISSRFDGRTKKDIWIPVEIETLYKKKLQRFSALYYWQAGNF